MKKLLIALALALVLTCLAACKKTEKTPDTTPDNTPADKVEDNTENKESTDDTKTEEGEFSFTLEGTKLIPGQKFDSASLREADSIFEVPSCALEGTDLVYNYTTVEVTAYDDGSGPVIYCIYFADANTPTDEGLMLGDSLDKAKSIYGEDFKEDAGQIIYTKGKTQLILLVENDSVISIEMRMITE